MGKHHTGIRTKLIIIFIFIKVLPLVALSWLAWAEITSLGEAIETKITAMMADTREVVKGVSELSTANSLQALDQKSREAIERLTTDTAMAVASFLYDRDRDIELASHLAPNAEQYEQFLATRFRPVILHEPWVMDPEGKTWVPETSLAIPPFQRVIAQNSDNRRDFHYRSPYSMGKADKRPLYLEMTFVDLQGREKIKVTSSDILSAAPADISDPANTYCHAEHYFQALKKLKPQETYVSGVIGPYVRGYMIGTYSQSRAQEMGMPFAPETSGYAGKENPVGKRFQGLVRWARPVLKEGKIHGYVTLALDHTHLMEFTDHIVPTDERYSPISDAGSGNYAFMWDDQGRNISHPRDYFIVGYDPQTGEQAVPWLDEELYALWTQSNGSMKQFQGIAPRFKEQSLAKKAALPLTRAGLVGLDGRYLNFAPQCSGWHNLTQHGGSGSFVIFWSGLWKLTTAATIPYYTGKYGQHPRGFGYVTIGANVDEFHRVAVETAQTIHKIETQHTEQLQEQKKENQHLIQTTVQTAFTDLTLYTTIMIVLVIAVAIFLAATLTRKITPIIQGFRRFQEGDRSYRLPPKSKDEIGQLVEAYNEMADIVEKHIHEMELSNDQIEQVNEQLTQEIRDRQQAQFELSQHRDNLEELVRGRTMELENEIVGRKRMETTLQEGQERLRRQSRALLLLATHPSLQGGELAASFQVIMKAAGQTLDVELSSIWLFDENQLQGRCQERYVLSTDSHFQEGVFKVADHAKQVEILKTNRTLSVSDVPINPLLDEAGNRYVAKHGIRSMLAASILEEGELVGMVFFEHVLMPRDWTLAEENFASSIADMVTLAIASAKRKQALKLKLDLEERLRQVEKMEAIGTLAGGVAHDLNNILSGIVSYPELLLHQMPGDSDLRKPMETISKAGKRAATIVQDLLTLSRRSIECSEGVNLNRVVEDYLSSPEHQKLLADHPQIDLQTQLNPGLVNILGSAVHLSKAIMNLVLNAVEAIAELGTHGTVTLSTDNRFIDTSVKGYDRIAKGDYAVLVVADTGVGISLEDRNRIFEPFYTNKKLGRSGTGLGMAVVWGTVKDHHGYIDFDSTPGQGSRFTLYFPASREAVPDASHFRIDEVQGQGESILVVDDIKEQREIASAILTALGYHVTTVASGEAAVAYLKQKAVDLLVLDMIMDPGMDGLDTYKAVIRLYPNQKAIVASGFSDTKRIEEALGMGAQYIKKPYTIEKISLAVRTALADRISL